MAYEKHTWQTGEPITKTLMDRLEIGLESASNKADQNADGISGINRKVGDGYQDQTMTQKINSLSNSLDNLAANYMDANAIANRVTAVEGILSDAKGTNFNSLADRLVSIDGKDSQLESALNAVQQIAEGNALAINNAKGGYNALVDRILNIESTNMAQSGNISDLNAAINLAAAVYKTSSDADAISLQVAMQRVQAAIGENSNRIATANTNISTNNTDIANLKTKIGYGYVGDAASDSRNLPTIIADARLEAQTGANTAESNAKSYADNLVAPINTEITGAHRDASDTLDARFDAIESDVSSLSTSLDTAESDIDALEGWADTAESDIDVLQAEISAAHRDSEDTLAARFGAIDTSIAALLNKASTEIKSFEWFNTDPAPVGSENVDYIIGPDSSNKYFYYKYIIDDSDNPWKLISGGGGGSGNSSALIFNSNAEFENATLTSKDENTDYYVKDSNGYYNHYRYNKVENDGVASYTLFEIKQDAYTTAQVYARSETYSKTETDNAIASALSNLDKDEYTFSYGTQLYYGAEGEAGADPGATPVETENVLSLFKTESGKDPISVSQTIITGGGGGGGTTGYAVTFNRITQTPVIVTGTASVILAFTYRCVDDENLPVSGTFTVRMGNTTITNNRALQQGENSIDVTEYCTTGTQRFRISIDTDGGVAVPAKYWDVQVVDVRLESTFNDRTIYSTNDSLNINYTPYGAVNKTIHFILDGVELPSVTTEISGTSMSYQLTPQSHGAHLLKMYITTTINGESITTDPIYKDIIFAQTGSRIPIISCIYRYDYYGELNIKQYNAFSIPYYVYDPRNPNPKIQLRENGTIVNNITASQSANTWSYKSIVKTTENNPNILVIACGDTEVELHVNVEDLGYKDEDLAPVTANLAFDFNPYGYSNNDTAHRDWVYNEDIKMTVSDNFDWNNGGYRLDSNGDPYFCVKSGTRATFSYKLFERDPKLNGAEFKIVFKTMNVRNITASFLKCLSPRYLEKVNPQVTQLEALYELVNGEYVLTEDTAIDSNKTYYENASAGLEMKAHEAQFSTSAGSLQIPYSEEDIIEFEYNINPIDTNDNAATSYIMTYEDGVGARPLIYDNSSTIHQRTNPSNIVIGSDDCDVWIYRMKAYSAALSDKDVLKNFHADARNAEEMINRYQRNLIYDKESGKLTPQSVAAACPDLRVIVIDAPYFTNDKANYVKDTTVQCIYTNGRPRDNWTWKNGFHVGQGTSSNRYGAAGRNIDIIFGFDGEHTVVSKIKPNTVQGYVSEVEFADGTVLTGANAKINLSDTSVENSWFNIKVNIASSENANNALLQKRYNQFLPYLSPARMRDSRVKNTMEFYNCVIFIRENDASSYDSASGTYTSHREFPKDCDYHFYGIGNIGDSKKTDNTRVNDPTDMKEFVVEVSDNNLPNSMFQTGVYRLDSGEITYDATGMDDAEKMARMVYPITEEQWNNENNMARKALSLEGYESGWDDEENEAIITNWDSTFEFRYDMGTKDGESYSDAELEAQQEQSKLVWNEMYKWVITASNDDFRAHLSDWFIQESPLYWYLFTERYIMIDNRAKNSFYHYGKVYISDDEYNGTVLANLQAAYEAASEDDKPAIHKQIIHAQSVYDNRAYYTRNNEAAAIREGYRFELWNYDDDTALGIDNSGLMKIPYGKEDIDKDRNGAYIYNAAENIFWRRIRGLTAELTALYTSTSLTACWSANNLIVEFDNWQNQFPEELWRLDIERKYLRPYGINNSGEGGFWDQTNRVYKYDPTFLRGMANGRKRYQRRQFERDQEIYLATKYLQSAVQADSIELRLSTADAESVRVVPVNDTIKITPYSDMYIRVMFGNANTVVSQRAVAGQEYEISPPTPITSRNTLQVTIYAASRIQGFSDLSAFYIRDNNFSRATKLKTLVLGNPTPGYKNTAIESLGIGANTLLETLDIRNLPNLTGALNLTQCDNLINLYATNTSLTSITFATAGKITHAWLPATLDDLTFRNLTMLTDLQIAGYNRLSSLTCINSNVVKPLAIIQAALGALETVTVTNLNWSLENTNLLNTIYEMNESLLTGTVTIDSNWTVRREELRHYAEKWGDEDIFKVIYNTDNFIEQYQFRFVIYDEALGEITKTLYEYYLQEDAPIIDPVYTGELDPPTKTSTVEWDYTFGTYVNGAYKNGSGWSPLSRSGNSWSINPNAEFPVGDTVRSDTGDQTYRAIFNATPRKYAVTWYSAPGVQVDSAQVEYNNEASATVIPENIWNSSIGEARVFSGWDKSTAHITANTDVYATWITGNLPSAATLAERGGLNGLNVAELYALSRTSPTNRAAILTVNNDPGAYIKDHIDITLGNDFNFSNITSQTLISEPFIVNKADQTTLRIFDGVARNDFNDPSIKPLSTNEGFTIALDFQYSSTGTDDTLFSCYSSSAELGSTGLRLALTMDSYDAVVQPHIIWGSSQTSIRVGNYAPTTSLATSGPNHHYRSLIVLRKPANSTSLSVYYSNKPYGAQQPQAYYDSIDVYTLPAVSQGLLDAPIVIGGCVRVGATGTYVYDQSVPRASGVIHWCKIWHDDLGDNICREIAAWPRETVRFELQGYNDRDTAAETYRVYNNNENRAQLTFFSASCIGDREYYRQSNTSQTGEIQTWYNAAVRNFCNTRIYNAFPREWRSILYRVPVKSLRKTLGSTGDSSLTEGTIANPGDYITIPTYYEMQGVNAAANVRSPYTLEDIRNAIPYIGTGNAGLVYDSSNNTSPASIDYSRIKFRGLYKPDNAKLFNYSSNPYNSTTVNPGDIWINTATLYAYMYVSEEQVQIYGYPIMTETAFQCASGGWVRSDSYWTRTAAQGIASENYLVVAHLGQSTTTTHPGVFTPNTLSSKQDHGIAIQFSI